MKVFAHVGKVFNAAWWLMGLETFSYRPGEDPDLIERVFDKCAPSRGESSSASSTTSRSA